MEKHYYQIAGYDNILGNFSGVHKYSNSFYIWNDPKIGTVRRQFFVGIHKIQRNRLCDRSDYVMGYLTSSKLERKISFERFLAVKYPRVIHADLKLNDENVGHGPWSMLFDTDGHVIDSDIPQDQNNQVELLKHKLIKGKKINQVPKLSTLRDITGTDDREVNEHMQDIIYYFKNIYQNEIFREYKKTGDNKPEIVMLNENEIDEKHVF